jgi:hypothetical protein
MWILIIFIAFGHFKKCLAPGAGDVDLKVMLDDLDLSVAQPAVNRHIGGYRWQSSPGGGSSIECLVKKVFKI